MLKEGPPLSLYTIANGDEYSVPILGFADIWKWLWWKLPSGGSRSDWGKWGGASGHLCPPRPAPLSEHQGTHSEIPGPSHGITQSCSHYWPQHQASKNEALTSQPSWKPNSGEEVHALQWILMSEPAFWLFYLQFLDSWQILTGNILHATLSQPFLLRRANPSSFLHSIVHVSPVQPYSPKFHSPYLCKPHTQTPLWEVSGTTHMWQ